MSGQLRSRKTSRRMCVLVVGSGPRIIRVLVCRHTPVSAIRGRTHGRRSGPGVDCSTQGNEGSRRGGGRRAEWLPRGVPRTTWSAAEGPASPIRTLVDRASRSPGRDRSDTLDPRHLGSRASSTGWSWRTSAGACCGRPCSGTTRGRRRMRPGWSKPWGAGEWARRIGIVPVASFTVSKWAWLRRVSPEVAAAARAVRLPHDYLTERLTGRA